MPAAYVDEMASESSKRNTWLSALREFWESDPLTLSASIAFYSSLSFAPIVVLALWAIARLSPGSEELLVDQLRSVFGGQVGAVANMVVEHADTRTLRFDAVGLIAIATLAVSATTAFAQFQFALNRVWGIAAPSANALWSWIRRRFLSLGLIAVFAFLMMVALIFSTALALLLTREGWIWTLLSELITIAVLACAFCAIYRYVPDIAPPWRGAMTGGIVTALLFEAGKWLLGAYLSNNLTGNAYGGAGAVVLLLTWVYYSALIVLIGAGIARHLMRWRGWWPAPVSRQTP
jgi:membrane protein